jgi:ribonuclease-3
MALARFTEGRYTKLAERLGYVFKDRELLRHALTHASSRRRHAHYERLEFLGDRVLGLIIAEVLFRGHPSEREGEMSARHSLLVCGAACAEAGRFAGIQDFILMGSNEQAKGLHLSNGVIGDVMEALIAAVFLDGGLAEARAFILRFWKPQLDLKARTITKDAKTYLQEWVLARALPIPAYRQVSRSGPEHAPHFVVAVEVQGFAAVEGEGPAKRLAEQDAAGNFLKREKIRA